LEGDVSDSDTKAIDQSEPATDENSRGVARRDLLKLGGIAAAGAAGATIASAVVAPPAGAAAGGNMILGQANNAGTQATTLTSSSSAETLLVSNTSTNRAGADLGVSTRFAVGDVAFGAGPNVRGLVKSPTTVHTPIPALPVGTGLAVWTSSDDPIRLNGNPNAIGQTANLLYDVTDGNSGTAADMGGMQTLTRNYDNSYTGAVVALQVYTHQFANASATLINADLKARVKSDVTTATPVLVGLEVGGEDRSQKIATNTGDAIHIVNSGPNDIRNGIYLASNNGTGSAWGTFENGLFMSTSSKGAVPAWSSQVYDVGDVVTSGGQTYQCSQLNNGSAQPAPPNSSFWQVWIARNQGPNVNFIWCGPATFDGAPTGTPLFQVGATGNVALNGFIELNEQSGDPAAPSANHVRLYIKDVSGKTQLCARFNTGAVQVLATQP
jgi:hypothetical protein